MKYQWMDQLQIGLLATELGFISESQLREAINGVANRDDISILEYLLQARSLSEEHLDRLASEFGSHQKTMLQKTQALQEPNGSLVTQRWADIPSRSLAEPQPLSRENKYSIIRQHAHGGLGVVYIAKDENLNRDVALKQIRQDRTGDSADEWKFLAEAEVTGQLEHPAIVPVYSMGLDGNDAPFYVMRFIRGKELKVLIREFHSHGQVGGDRFYGVAFRQLLKHFLDVCNGVEYAHSRGILHRDLKPANIMVGRHGETFVLDWGLAKSILSTDPSENNESKATAPIRPRAATESTQTQDGTFGGTIGYASPEQLQGLVSQLGPASDVYALGSILFEILTGKHAVPTTSLSINQIVSKIQEGSFATAREIEPKLPLALSMICAKAMRYEPNDRYASPSQLALDIERWLADERVSAIESREPLLEKAGRWLRRYRTWTIPIVASIALITLVSVLGAVLINRARLNEQQAKLQERQAKLESNENKSIAIARLRDARSTIDALLAGAQSLPSLPALEDLKTLWDHFALESYQKLSDIESVDPELKLEQIRDLIHTAELAGRLQMYELSHACFVKAKQALQKEFDSSASHGVEKTVRCRIMNAECLNGEALIFEKENQVKEARDLFHQSLLEIESIASRDFTEDDEIRVASLKLKATEFEAKCGDSSKAKSMLQSFLRNFNEFEATTDPQILRLRLRLTKSLVDSQLLDGESAQAIELLKSAILETKNVIGASSQREAAYTLALLQNSLGDIYRRGWLLNESANELGQSLQLFSELREQWPNSLDIAQSVADLQANLGLLRLDQQRLSEAKEFLLAAYYGFDELQGSYPTLKYLRHRLLTVLDGLIQTMSSEEHDINEAEQLFGHGRVLVRDWLRTEDDASSEKRMLKILTANMEGHFAQACTFHKDDEKARSHFQESERLFVDEIVAKPEDKQIAYSLAEVEWKHGLLERKLENEKLAMELLSQATNRMLRLIEADGSNQQYRNRYQQIMESKGK